MRAGNFARTASKCVFTVDTDTNNDPAISAFVRPRATNSTTSNSRSVKISTAFTPADTGSLNRSNNRTVTDGDTNDSPLAAARTASTSNVGPESFNKNPVAPERNAPYTYSSVSNVVTTTIRGPEPFPPASSIRVASRPSSLGIRISNKHTSGFNRRASATATTPSGASATTSISA
ncbi:hypothetical protein SAMN05216270_101386 [Glycomyces harbinensis]|uniref:Uncharacterized protein n=1 Tax=Glycomyces harbinensis TaxID=58114 RepID=A0A1G6RAI7_9ACTN|nr:hypothetical protein SAMN05216270_101386 [Glycomyces harbinensis]